MATHIATLKIFVFFKISCAFPRGLCHRAGKSCLFPAAPRLYFWFLSMQDEERGAGVFFFVGGLLDGFFNPCLHGYGKSDNPYSVLVCLLKRNTHENGTACTEFRVKKSAPRKYVIFLFLHFFWLFE